MKLGDIVSLVRGNTYKSSLLSETDGPVLLGLGSIARNGGFKFGAWKHYPGPSDSRILLHPGDLYVSLKDLTQACSLLGAVARVPNEISVGRLTQDTVKLEFKAEVSKREKSYTYWSLRTPQYRAYCKARGMGTTNMSLSRTDFLDWEIPQPSTSRDRLIKLLEDTDRLATLNQRTNDYLADLLQALQKQIEGTEELAEFRADELFDIHIGKTPPRKEPEWFSLDRAGNVIWMSIKDMGSGDVYLIDSSEYLTAEAVEKHNVKKCSPGSILLSFKLTIGRVGIAANEMVTNEAIACFSSDDSRKLAYLYPLLKSYDYASLGSTSSIATAVNSKMIKAMTIKMPSSAALDRYYAQTKPIYDLLLDNTREAAALAELRDALLPKLMSGELDVSEVELSTQLNNHLGDC